jgi:hypothetical protein
MQVFYAKVCGGAAAVTDDRYPESIVDGHCFSQGSSYLANTVGPAAMAGKPNQGKQ